MDPFRLDRREPPLAGVRRIAAAQVETASTCLDRIDADPEDAVHQARTSLKKARAMLRLLRPHVPPPDRRRAARQLRDAGRALSRARDGAVRVHTLDRLLSGEAATPRLRVVAAWRDVLAGVADAELEALLKGGGLASARSGIQAASAEVHGWKITTGGFPALRPALGRATGRARRAFAEAGDGRDVERFHECRKRLKDLWYQCRVLEPVVPARLEDTVASLDACNDLLGLANDFESLAHHVERSPGPPGAVDGPDLASLARARRDELWTRVVGVGRTVFDGLPAVLEPTREATAPR